MNKEIIGKFLRTLRKEKNLTQIQLSNELGGIYSDATISKWERGESIPNIEDFELLAHFYGVSIDEILNGERIVEINFDKKYFLSNEHWYQQFSTKDNLYEIREKQELEIEIRFKSLLKKMISEGLTLNEDVEFNYLLENFYTIYTDYESDDVADIIKNTKFQIVKTASLMHNSSVDEKFWEVYKLFESHFIQTIKRDVCNALEDAESILRERVSNLEIFEKDMLLAAIQVENVTNGYGIQDRKMAEFRSGLSSLYEKTYNRPYDEEQLTKNAIKLLVECGARLNPLLFGYQRNNIIEINILDRLIELYDKFKKPIVIPVYEEQVYNFYEVDNTPKNRKKRGYDNADELLDEAEYNDLERRLYRGELILKKVVPEWVGGQTEEEMIKYMWSIICDLSLKDYLLARDERMTNEMVNRLDEVSLEDIRREYFIRRDI